MCCAKQERNELIRELKEIGCKEFTINNILNTKQGSGEIIRSVLKFIKHSVFLGISFNIAYRLKSLHTPTQVVAVCDSPINP